VVRTGLPEHGGRLGGDIDGKFGGTVLKATPNQTGGVQLTAIYIVVATDPSRSLTIRLDGVDQSGTAVLNGRVVDGYLTGARARAAFKVFDCEQSDGPCFQGTMSIKQRGDDEEDDDD
jgi:hypothetical protein